MAIAEKNIVISSSPWESSVMDLAKAAATFCLTDNSSADYLATGKSIPAEHLPVMAVPTTAGTGK